MERRGRREKGGEERKIVERRIREDRRGRGGEVRRGEERAERKGKMRGRMRKGRKSEKVEMDEDER